MQPFVRNMLNRQRKRVVATILQHAESSFYDVLTQQQRDDFRAKVLGAVSQYHDTSLDLLNSSVNDGMMLNEEAVRVMAEFNRMAQLASDQREAQRAAVGSG